MGVHEQLLLFQWGSNPCRPLSIETSWQSKKLWLFDEFWSFVLSFGFIFCSFRAWKFHAKIEL